MADASGTRRKSIHGGLSLTSLSKTVPEASAIQVLSINREEFEQVKGGWDETGKFDWGNVALCR